jgi:hypothetical protein
MRHPASKALFAHWSELKRGSIIPDRNDLDPAAIGAILQDVFILGAGHEGDWRYRVAGTRLASFAARELRDEAFESWWRLTDRRDTRRMTEGAGAGGMPLVGGVSGAGLDGASHSFELILLPLRHGGRLRTRILGGLFPAPSTVRRIGVRVSELNLISIRALGTANPDVPAFGQKPDDLEAILERRRAFRVIEGGAAIP